MSVRVPSPASALVVPLHAAVPGRLRVRVRGLRRAPALAAALERALPGRAGIRAASASPRTGSVLLQLAAEASTDAVLAAVAATARELSGDEALLAAPLPRRRLVPERMIADAPFSARLVRRTLGALRGRGDDAVGPRTPVRDEEDGARRWDLETADAVSRHFATPTDRGLDYQEAAARLRRHGANEMPRPEPRPGHAIFLDQLETLPVAMLAGSAVISLLTGGVADAVVIAGVCLLNAAIGWITESQSERTIRALTGFQPAEARVLRDGAVRQVPGSNVVPGDVLVVGPGSPVVADARVLRARRLAVDESALTGESAPVTKRVEPVAESDTPLRDRTCMLYRGTMVTAGSGRAVVTATGPGTEIGRIEELVGTARPPETPSQEQLRVLGNQLVAAGGVLCVAMFGVGALRGMGLVPMLRTAISLAVAALPEGLPTVATTTLALGVRDLRREGVLVRHLSAIETLGAVQVLCLDKTGTITLNRMTVTAVSVEDHSLRCRDGQIGDEGLTEAGRDTLRRLVEACVLCNEADFAEADDGGERLEGSPTETAFLRLAADAGMDVRALRRAHPLLKMHHRSDDRNYMVSVHEAEGGGTRVAIKGSPSEVLELCKGMRRGGEVEPLGDEERSAVDAENGRMAGEALRVLAVAETRLDAGATPPDDPADLAFDWLGLVGMVDPPRAEVSGLLERLHGAGIATSMITGDQSATAYAVARQIGLAEDGQIEILDSTHIEKVPPEVLSTLAQRVRVFSRVSPTHKLEIVQALQRVGRVVAMTGDGVNDGPALKAADVGIAMGSGSSEIARTVAGMVLERDGIEALVEAVGRGRAIHENTRKAIHFLLSSNLSEILVMFGGVSAGLGQPLSAMHLLWLNLITDIFPGLGLAVEPPAPDVLERPARDPHERLLRRSDFARIGSEGALLTAGALGSYAAAVRRHGRGPAATTVAFMTLTTGQLLHALSCRSETQSLFDRGWQPPNPALGITVGVSLALQLALPFLPGLSGLLRLTRPSAADWLSVALGAGLPLLANEALKRARVWQSQPSVAEPEAGRAAPPRGEEAS